MSKILLFVCLVLFGTVLGQTQIRLLNAKYFGSLVVGITPDTNLVGNTTITDGVAAKFDNNPSPVFPASGYVSLPLYEFTVGTELTLYAFDRDNFPEGPVDTFTSLENVTLVELQSYSLIYVGETEDFSQERVPISDRLLLVEERPNPSPVGKALVRIVNVAISTFESSNMEAVVNGTGVADRLVSLAFGEASEFLEFDTAGTLKLYTSLPAAEGATKSRTIEFTTAIGFTTMVYIRGDLSSPSQLGEKVDNIEFAFPAAPSAPVAAPTAPTAAPVDAPTAPTAPTAPVAAPAGTPTRAPTKRVSSAATTVAQIAGVAVVMSLLF